MSITDLIPLMILSMIVMINILTLAYYLPRIREIVSEKKEASEILKDMLTELHNRLDAQERKIADQEIKIDLIEVKVNRFMKSSEYVKPSESISQDSEIKEIVKEIKQRLESLERPVTVASQPKSHHREREELTPTENEILKLLEGGAMTSQQIRMKIGKSREHTTRLMKKLFEKGYVRRIEDKKPYLYELVK
ncbi:MAG: helix-turn-helix domain-containing protein [Nitrososphaerota archaeon]|nr:MarR family transcriptional regulator [Nitrososphaerales archaeon]MDW8045185.1 helix-turn-helix domain-containing protein [Nitrososphaerota archaeon]